MAATNTRTFPSSPLFSPSAASPLQAVSSPLVLPLPSLKLTEENYLVWRHFMLATLTSNHANGFILGNEIPQRFLSDDDRELATTCGWLCSLVVVVGGLLVNALIFIGTPISNLKHIDYILDGLNEEYQPIITSIESQMDLPTIHNLESFLLTFEARLEKGKHKALSDALSHSSIAPSSFYPSRFEPQHHSQYIGFGTSGNYRGGYGGNRGRFGLAKYPAHFYLEYLGDFLHGQAGPYSSQFVGDSLLGLGLSPAHRYTHQFYSMTTQGDHREPPLPSSKDTKRVTWYPDSRATNHLTTDASFVHEPVETFGHDQIYMGNGKGIPIKSIGNSFFTSSINSPASLSLNNLLLVPAITKNLNNVSQFAKDNFCYFELLGISGSKLT
ncbi:PREDICTED: uncharacterized protein LOC109341093 [Lupinus angustifolius]|uniref:uncharacterized protein LOC109341093 n=1 Tax=Lupinus angustifolius TaxID=3871 RepID=UPI00092E2B60|nr:PREDICTED: uncharacterized protein LOC109341093 [Lupinus angustifolius]